jgi:hypothetical protein
VSIRVEIFDGTTPYLEKVAKISLGMALECLSVAGAIVQKNAQNEMRRQKHHWFQKIGKDGKIKSYYNPNQLRELGLRVSSKNAKEVDPNSMSKMITSYLMENSFTVVVGGKHPRFHPKKRDNGIVTGYLKAVDGTSKRTFAILHKLNTGESDAHYDTEGGRYAKNRRKGYQFMDKAYRSSQAAIIDAMTRRYERLFHKATNNITVEARKVG